MGIRGANKNYELWLAAELKGDIVEDDVKRKRRWFCTHAESAAEFVRREQQEWKQNGG